MAIRNPLVLALNAIKRLFKKEPPPDPHAYGDGSEEAAPAVPEFRGGSGDRRVAPFLVSVP